MAKTKRKPNVYTVEFTDKVTFSIDIEAMNEDEAYDKIQDGNFDISKAVEISWDGDYEVEQVDLIEGEEPEGGDD